MTKKKNAMEIITRHSYELFDRKMVEANNNVARDLHVRAKSNTGLPLLISAFYH